VSSYIHTHIHPQTHHLHQSRLNTMNDAMKCAAERKEDREGVIFIESERELKYLTEV